MAYCTTPQAQITYDPNNEWEDRWYDLRPPELKAKLRNMHHSSPRYLLV